MRMKRIPKRSMSIELMKRGCNLVKVEPNKHNNNLKVYSFEVNEQLVKSLDEIMKCS